MRLIDKTRAKLIISSMKNLLDDYFIVWEIQLTTRENLLKIFHDTKYL